MVETSQSSGSSCSSDGASTGSLSESSGGSIYSASIGSEGGTAYVLMTRSTIESAILDAIGYALGESKISPDKRPDYSKQYVSVAVRYDDQSKPLERPYGGSNDSGSIDSKMNYSRSIGDKEKGGSLLLRMCDGNSGDNIFRGYQSRK